MIKFLDLNKQYLQIKKEIDACIQRVIDSTSFINSTEARKFESAFAKYQQAQHCVAVANGTDAIEIALQALNLEKDSEVIVPANTFIASSEAVTNSGLKVVFCDADPANYTLNLQDVAKKITPKTSAIIAVHLYGHPCDIDAIKTIIKGRNIKILEDCAQAHGSEYKGKRLGALGDVGTFSFYPGKTLGAYGDAGAIVTNNSELAQKCRMLANHGRLDKYDHALEGRNSRMDEIQAAILNVKLNHLEDWSKRRTEIAKFYLNNLKLKTVTLPKYEDHAHVVPHLFVVRISDREKLQEHLKKSGIETGIHYPIALPKLKAYEYLNAKSESFWACQADSQLLSLPIGEHMSLDDAKTVVDRIYEFYE